MSDITAIAREAWASTKKEPSFDELESSYRDRLLDRAKVVEADKRVSNEGADVFRQFEQTVLELLIPERFHPA